MCFYENGIQFNIARGLTLIRMLRFVGSYVQGLELPSMYEFRTYMLDEKIRTTTKLVDKVKRLGLRQE